MAQEKDGAMNGTGIVDLGFPMWPQFNPKSYDDVVECLKSGKVNYWTGKKGFEFEEKWAKWIGAEYAISCTNGTAALHIAISALNIGPGRGHSSFLQLYSLFFCNRSGRSYSCIL